MASKNTPTDSQELVRHFIDTEVFAERHGIVPALGSLVTTAYEHYIGDSDHSQDKDRWYMFLQTVHGVLDQNSPELVLKTASVFIETHTDQPTEQN